MSGPAPDVSFVVATYRRPEVLEQTLRAVRNQSAGEWELVVVGDCCDERTEAVVRAFADPRLRYYNLPARYGEQGGPNSVGMAVARARWLTFLNHDDLLLPDHIDVAIGEGDRRGVDVLSTRFTSVTALRSIEPAAIDADFREVFPMVRSRSDVMARRSLVVEPASAWTVRRETALAVGPWRRWRSSVRTPAHDWMIRALRRAGRWHFDERLTGVYVSTHAGNGLHYDAPADGHRWLVDAMSVQSPDEFRRVLAAAGAPTVLPRRSVVAALEHGVSLAAYRALGIDPVAVARRVRGTSPGGGADAVLRRRTGETSVEQSRLAEYLADPEALRVL